MTALVGVVGLLSLVAAAGMAGWRLSNANHLLNRLIANDAADAAVDGPPL